MNKKKLLKPSKTKSTTAKKSKEKLPKEIKISTKKAKIEKVKKIKDKFSFTKQDYEKLSELKKTCLNAGVQVKKREILTAGVRLLNKLNITELKKAVDNVQTSL